MKNVMSYIVLITIYSMIYMLYIDGLAPDGSNSIVNSLGVAVK